MPQINMSEVLGLAADEYSRVRAQRDHTMALTEERGARLREGRAKQEELTRLLDSTQTTLQNRNAENHEYRARILKLTEHNNELSTENKEIARSFAEADEELAYLYDELRRLATQTPPRGVSDDMRRELHRLAARRTPEGRVLNDLADGLKMAPAPVIVAESADLPQLNRIGNAVSFPMPGGKMIVGVGFYDATTTPVDDDEDFDPNNAF